MKNLEQLIDYLEERDFQLDSYDSVDGVVEYIRLRHDKTGQYIYISVDPDEEYEDELEDESGLEWEDLDLSRFEVLDLFTRVRTSIGTTKCNIGIWLEDKNLDFLERALEILDNPTKYAKELRKTYQLAIDKLIRIYEPILRENGYPEAICNLWLTGDKKTSKFEVRYGDLIFRLNMETRALEHEDGLTVVTRDNLLPKKA